MKLKKIIIMALCLSLVMTCGVFLAACNKGGGEGGGDTYVPRNSNQWFTEAELAKKGLSALPAPTGLSGDMSSDLNWYNDGYSFIRHVPTKTRSRKTPRRILITSSPNTTDVSVLSTLLVWKNTRRQPTSIIIKFSKKPTLPIISATTRARRTRSIT